MDNMTIINRFSILLAEKRIKAKRNISLAEVARDTGISRKTLLSWANNDVTRYDVPVMNALCQYFNCTPGDLFDYEDVKHDPERFRDPTIIEDRNQQIRDDHQQNRREDD